MTNETHAASAAARAGAVGVSYLLAATRLARAVTLGSEVHFDGEGSGLDEGSSHGAGPTEYYVSDRHGSTVALTDHWGTVTTTYEYSDYGQTTTHTAQAADEPAVHTLLETGRGTQGEQAAGVHAPGPLACGGGPVISPLGQVDRSNPTAPLAVDSVSHVSDAPTELSLPAPAPAPGPTWANIPETLGTANAALANRFQYSGEYTNASDDTQNLGDRIYDPNSFGFNTRDTADQFNLYAYAASNPITLVDPSGETPSRDIVTQAVFLGVVTFASLLSAGSLAAPLIALDFASSGVEAVRIANDAQGETGNAFLGSTASTVLAGVGVGTVLLSLAFVPGVAIRSLPKTGKELTEMLPRGRGSGRGQNLGAIEAEDGVVPVWRSGRIFDAAVSEAETLLLLKEEHSANLKIERLRRGWIDPASHLWTPSGIAHFMHVAMLGDTLVTKLSYMENFGMRLGLPVGAVAVDAGSIASDAVSAMKQNVLLDETVQTLQSIADSATRLARLASAVELEAQVTFMLQVRNTSRGF